MTFGNALVVLQILPLLIFLGGAVADCYLNFISE